MIFDKNDANHNEQCFNVSEFWGEKKMTVMVVEELAELSQVLCKYERYYLMDDDADAEVWAEYYEPMIKEMADVYIALEALQWIFSGNDLEEKLGMDDEIMEAINKKLNKKYD